MSDKKKFADPANEHPNLTWVEAMYARIEAGHADPDEVEFSLGDSSKSVDVEVVTEAMIANRSRD